MRMSKCFRIPTRRGLPALAALAAALAVACGSAATATPAPTALTSSPSEQPSGASHRHMDLMTDAMMGGSSSEKTNASMPNSGEMKGLCAQHMEEHGSHQDMTEMMSMMRMMGGMGASRMSP